MESMAGCRKWRIGWLWLVMALATAVSAVAQSSGPPATVPLQKGHLKGPITVIDLQPARQQQSIPLPATSGKVGSATLTNLNPNVNMWYLLSIRRPKTTAVSVYHLENPYPNRQTFKLDPNRPGGLVIEGESGPQFCALWTSPSQSVLKRAAGMKLSYVQLCNERVYLRNPTKGNRTAIETVTDLLRDNIPGGESIVGFVRDTFFKGSFRKEAEPVAGKGVAHNATVPGWPAAAEVAAGKSQRLISHADLGIPIKVPAGKGVRPGSWYAVRDNPGIFISLIQPKAVPKAIFKSYPSLVKGLEPKEMSALVYLIAFDLDRFDLGFSVGTDHPRVNWSGRVPKRSRDKRLSGPDGIDSIFPLQATGLISPRFAVSTVATFTGGFKRSHGAFKYGKLSTTNHGSHYGFVESGVVLSRLQPGLSTLFVMSDGEVNLKTWQSGDNKRLSTLRHARQNGVAIIETDPANGQGIPGPLVSRWGRGNWSGSKDKRLRTLRAAVALQESQGRRFLIYGYFSSATPSAMARVFQAYGCRYAMHMDMNALEHTYLAIYQRQGDNLLVQHLIKEMNVLDKTDRKRYVPRFLGYSDNRDFFYLMRRQKGDPVERRN